MQDLNCVSPKELDDKGYIAKANKAFFQQNGLMLIYIIDAFTGDESLEVINVSNKDLHSVVRRINDDFLQTR